MKFIETKFKMIDLILKSWNISKEDRENLGIDELLKLNQELNKADFDFNENETSNIDLVKMMEYNFQEKKKNFWFKKTIHDLHWRS